MDREMQKAANAEKREGCILLKDFHFKLGLCYHQKIIED